MASIEWLESELASLDAAVVLVAHDRWFLEAVSTAVLELDAGRATFFPGTWHVWRQEKAARALNAAKVAERQAEDIARLERFVARFRYGTKSRQAQAKLKQIARIEAGRVEAPRGGRRTLGFEFLKPARSGRVVLDAEDVTLAAGDKPLLAHASLALERGEHVALVGPNGSGKTTLLEAIIGDPRDRRRPAADRPRRGDRLLLAARGGARRARLGARVHDGRRPVCSGRRRRRCSAGSSSPGWDAHEKPVVALSGGERRRLALALVVASGANFLVLDEPTNHLDLESREALEAALEAFPGTVLLVTHDRALLDAVAERIVELDGRSLRSFPGGWADLVRRRSEEREAAAAPPRRVAQGGEAEAASPKPAPRRPSELDRVEASIAAAEARVAELERQLAEDWGNVDTLAAHRAARDELQSLLARWEQLFEAAQA